MVWKKSDDYPQPEQTASQPRPTSAPAPAPVAAAAPSQPEPRRGERATIGPSIFIKGDLTGEEDLIIQGRVEGKVDLKQHNLTIGGNGRVRADVYGRVVIVEGEVHGNVFAQEQAVVKTSGTLHGNITSPRVTLEDGSKFKGAIDMDAKDLPRQGERRETSAGGAGGDKIPTEARAAGKPA